MGAAHCLLRCGWAGGCVVLGAISGSVGNVCKVRIANSPTSHHTNDRIAGPQPAKRIRATLNFFIFGKANLVKIAGTSPVLNRRHISSALIDLDRASSLQKTTKTEKESLEETMSTIEVSNTFLIGVIVAFVILRIVCECTKDTHMRPQLPSDIRFTMNSIPNFVTTPEGQIGGLADFIDELLLHGDQLAMMLQPIRIVHTKSRWWALDNRRLYALRLAEGRGAVSTVRHVVLRLEDPQVQREFAQKYCTQSLGKTVNVEVDNSFRWGPEYKLKEG